MSLPTESDDFPVHPFLTHFMLFLFIINCIFCCFGIYFDFAVCIYVYEAGNFCFVV